MKKALLLVIISASVILSSCGSGESERKKFKYQTASKNDIDKKAEIIFTADTSNRTLEFEFYISNPSGIPFPVHKESKDTCRYTSYRFEFLCDGKPITLSDQKFECFHRRMNYRIPPGSSTLIFQTDTLHALQRNSIKISVPFYFFSSIAAGNGKDIQLRVYQDEFFSEIHAKKQLRPNAKEISEAANGDHYNDSLDVIYRNSMPQRLVDMQVSFKLNIPKVYSSTFICKKITLQNDKDWSPAGSDITLFKSSYPDLYFETFFPAPQFLMHTSHIQKSTDEWNIGDTSEIVYYNDKDVFKISVLDWDKFSHDDPISIGECTIEQLKKSESVPVKFDHITGFVVRFENTKTKN
ncbi:MAG: hypothetical protein IAF38_08045 [Bacteroidia bacterium]|nr:hypothetical protein [Bacteroidia bacterium]